MKIDITCSMNKDTDETNLNGNSSTLNKYNVFLWSRTLNGKQDFQLRISNSKSCDLVYEGYPRTFKFICDSILPNYSKCEPMKHIVKNIEKKEADELSNLGRTVGGYILFPTGIKSGKPDINESRLSNPKIMGRFDLTLECIKRWYINKKSPLYDDIDRYRDFFELFNSFKAYVDYFLLRDMLDSNYRVIFWTPFTKFKGSPLPKDEQEYKRYVEAANTFIFKRNQRILKLAKKKQVEESSNEELESIQEKFHQVIIETANDFGLTKFLKRKNKNLPKIQHKNFNKRMWFPILGMYGGFAYYLVKKDGRAVLFVDSWSRVIGGSETECAITSESIEKTIE